MTVFVNVYPYGEMEHALFVVPVVQPDFGDDEDFEVTATDPVCPEMYDDPDPPLTAVEVQVDPDILSFVANPPYHPDPPAPLPASPAE